MVTLAVSLVPSLLFAFGRLLGQNLICSHAQELHLSPPRYWRFDQKGQAYTGCKVIQGPSLGRKVMRASISTGRPGTNFRQ